LIDIMTYDLFSSAQEPIRIVTAGLFVGLIKQKIRVLKQPFER
jgi:hypothetical protein